MKNLEKSDVPKYLKVSKKTCRESSHDRLACWVRKYEICLPS